MNGQTLSYIALDLGTTQAHVLAVIRKHGIPMRDGRVQDGHNAWARGAVRRSLGRIA